MHALCEVFTLNGTTVFSATLAQLSFCLTDVVITTSWAGDDIKQITSVTCEMVAELKGFEFYPLYVDIHGYNGNEQDSCHH